MNGLSGKTTPEDGLMQLVDKEFRNELNIGIAAKG